MTLPLVVNGVDHGDLPTSLSRGTELMSVQAAAFIEAVGGLLVDTLAERLKALPPSGGFLAASELRSLGLQIQLDTARLVVDVRIPTDLQRAHVVNLRPRFKPASANLAPAADLSGYVNLRGALTYVEQSPLPDELGRQPFLLDIDGAIRAFDLALEGAASYTEIGDEPLQRGPLRLVKDWADRSLRGTAGDLFYGVTGFQTLRQGIGLDLARNFRLQPDRITTPSGNAQFILEREAQVDVYVNGQRAQTLRLAPGRYDVRNLPVTVGTNDVALAITDNVGRQQVLQFPLLYDTSLLAGGEQEFDYAIGFGNETFSTGSSYNLSDPFLSAFHHVGMTDELTVGTNLQVSAATQMSGIEMRQATPFGIFRLDFAGGHVRNAAPDLAARFQYLFASTSDAFGFNPSFLATASYTGRRFPVFDDPRSINPVSLDVSVLYSQQIFGDLSGSVGLTHQFGRPGFADSNAIDVGFRQRISSSLFSSLTLSRREIGGSTPDNRVLFSISWSPTDARYSVLASQENDTTQVSWNYTPSNSIEGWRGGATVEAGPDVALASGNLRYVGNRAEANIQHLTSRVEGGIDQRSSLQFGTALAFADGHVGVSRPISDSFVMIAPNPLFEDKRLEVQSFSGAKTAERDWLGPPLLPTVQSYEPQRIFIDAPELPIGYDLGQQTFDVVAGYRSGTVLHVGTDATVMLDARLRFSTGAPVPLKTGVIVSRDDPTRPEIPFFTNRAGRLRVEGLHPGKWMLRLADGGVELPFTIPADAAGIYNVGVLITPPSP